MLKYHVATTNLLNVAMCIGLMQPFKIENGSSDKFVNENSLREFTQAVI